MRRALDGVDDVQFAREVIEDVGGKFPIDRDRIYATGFSGGARMSSRLACALSDVLAAAAPVAGLQYPDDCVPAGPVSIVAFHGKADAVNQYEVTADSRPYWRMGVETAAEKWRSALGCPEGPMDGGFRGEPGVTVRAWTGRFDPDGRISGDDRRQIGAGIDWTPVPGLQLRLWGRRRGAPADVPGGRDDEAAAEVHVYF